MDEHGSAVLSDLSEYHGIDLVATVRDHTHSPQTLWALLENLPDTSALAAALRKEPRGWGYDRHLQLAAVNVAQIHAWLTASSDGKKARKPTLIQSPKPQKKRVIRVADLVRAEGGE